MAYVESLDGCLEFLALDELGIIVMQIRLGGPMKVDVTKAPDWHLGAIFVRYR